MPGRGMGRGRNAASVRLTGFGILGDTLLAGGLGLLYLTAIGFRVKFTIA